jgi:predicted PurR-regulated permease PerM
MDLFVLIIILLAGFIIKYLIDVISSLSKEIKEIKNKCIKTSTTKNLKTTTKTPIEKMNNDIIKGVSYFKDYFD